MDQMSFADIEYQNKKRKTRRELCLERMDSLIPWSRLVKKLKRHYHKGRVGRSPYPLEMMLRIHCMQLFYNLSDPGMEDALYEIESMRRFAGLRLSDRIPDETTILNFRHFLEEGQRGKKLFQEINAYLGDRDLMLREGSIVDASIIAAPSSTKNADKKRDPEMHQTKKGNQWHFGMKVHIGVDDEIGLIHSLETTAANTHDLEVSHKLLHGHERRVFGDAVYRRIAKRAKHSERSVDWYIAERPSKRKELDPDSAEAKVENLKAQIRAKVEHPFRYMKRVFGYSKVRYRGQAKNRNRFHVLAGLTNLMIAQKLLPT